MTPETEQLWPFATDETVTSSELLTSRLSLLVAWIPEGASGP